MHYGATFDGRDLELTSREFEFLAYLARNAGKVCTRRMILENVCGPGYAGELDYLKVYAYRIRRKLGGEDGRFLQSDPSIGYRLAWRDWGHQIDGNRLWFGNLTVTGFNSGSYIPAHPQEIRPGAEAALAAVAAGLGETEIDALPFSGAVTAHQRMESRELNGRIVLTPNARP